MATPQELGFSKAPKEYKKRLLVSAEALQKRGKDNFLYTAPEPIFSIDIDDGSEGVIEKFAHKEIYLNRIRMPEILENAQADVNKKTFLPVWEQLKNTIKETLKFGEGTLGLNTASDAYDICRLANFGKISQVPSHLYVDVGLQWKEIIRECKESSMNVVFLHRLKPQFNNPSVLELKGYPETPYEFQVHVRLNREDPDNFSLVIVDSRHNPNVNGHTLAPKELVSFDMLMAMVHG